ncbi:hypothetical protein FRC07_000590 [Ceratobasidium sp. 392]|nr:hypothetical protein FRC07_000590 [Ceratobasidium sp. 392]
MSDTGRPYEGGPQQTKSPLDDNLIPLPHHLDPNTLPSLLSMIAKTQLGQTMNGAKDRKKEFSLKASRDAIRHVSHFNHFAQPLADMQLTSQFRQSFGYHGPSVVRRASREEFKRVKSTTRRKPAPSGVLSPKFTPTQANFIVPTKPKWEPKDTRPRLPKPLDRHTHWRLTPSESLPGSPLNPTTTRANMLSRKNTTLLGSEDHVTLQMPDPSDQPLPPSSEQVTGSTSQQCRIAPLLCAFSKDNPQPKYPPPPYLKNQFSTRKLDGTLFEQHVAQACLGSKARLQEWNRRVGTLTQRILKVRNAGPVFPELLDLWNWKLDSHKALMVNARNTIGRKSYAHPEFSALLEGSRNLIKPKLRNIEDMISHLRSPETNLSSVGLFPNTIVTQYFLAAMVLNDKPRVIQKRASSPTIIANNPPIVATISVGDHASQPHQNLRATKRMADGDSAQGSSIQLVEERPAKRRCT